MNRRSLLKKGAVGSFVALAGCFGLAAMAPSEEESGNSGSGSGSASTQTNSGGTESNSESKETQSSDSSKESTEEANKESTKAKAKSGPQGSIKEHDTVKVLSASYKFEMFMGPVVSGKIENTADESLSQVELQVHYYDGEDTRIGEGMGLVSDLKAGGTATYEASGLSADVEKGDISRWELTVKVIDM